VEVEQPGEIDMALVVRSSSHTYYTFAEYKMGQISAHLPQQIMVIHPELAIFLKRHGFETKGSL